MVTYINIIFKFTFVIIYFEKKLSTEKNMALPCEELGWIILLPFREFGIQSLFACKWGERGAFSQEWDCGLERSCALIAHTGVCNQIHLWALTVLGPALTLNGLLAPHYGLEVSWFRNMFWSTMEQGCSSYFLCFKSFKDQLLLGLPGSVNNSYYVW